MWLLLIFLLFFTSPILFAVIFCVAGPPSAMRFLRNHTLYLLCQFGVKLGSIFLKLFDRMAIVWHTSMSYLMSSFPKARIQFAVHEPTSTYHPAILITGTSSGIGHDAALAFASRGYTVFAVVRREEDGEKVRNDFQELLKPSTITSNPWQRSRLDSIVNELWKKYSKCNTIYSLEPRDSDDEEPAESTASATGKLSINTDGLRNRKTRLDSSKETSSDKKSIKSDAKHPKIWDILFQTPTYPQLLSRAGKVIPVIMDVTDDESVDRALDEIQAQLTLLKVPFVALINNAGVSAPGPMETANPDFIDKSFAVNYLGPLRLTQKVLPWLRQNQGRVINVSSIMSWLIGPGFGVYCSSKAALTVASRSWRYELASFGVSLSVIEPGLTKTSIWNKLSNELQLHHTQINQIRLPPPLVPQSPSTPVVESDPSKIYGSMYQQIRANHELFPFMALPTDHVVEALVHSITSQFPKGTYRVGWDARLLSIATWILSEDVVDWLCRVIGIVSEN
ncbi:hypothetical protein H4219_001502 [Mycoemilia scoparia]|uniref:Uncharacterized protein n=1 Tax=Mycoemilia scoparia TaxID=417184 RepID=A0A9W8A4K6_9FUNG|nr:hypothetical protein H4219_001502 [Mycoemilia scoparia]